MKIGVITFWDTQDNYGQILQCYALQYYLKREGHTPYLIRYIPQVKSKTKLERLLSLWKLFSPKRVKAYKEMLQNKKKNKSFDVANPRYFDEFRTIYLSMSDSIYYSFDSLEKENWNFDVFICGSDQIWSYSPVYNNIKAYFLQFVPEYTKKIAYATSFGRAKLPKDFSNRLPFLIKKFDYIGLREESGLKLCTDAKRSDSKLVCDPTILLYGKDYISSIVKKEIIETNTVFTYLLNWETKFPIDQVKEFIKDKELELTFFGAHGVGYHKFFEPADDLTLPSWLNSMVSSKYVFTNSFHGTVFALLFKKPFISFPLSGNSASMNDRVITLLNRVGLGNRIYNSSETIDNILKDEINWTEIDEKLEKFRQESQSFLIEALK